jgi:hypothetical protein
LPYFASRVNLPILLDNVHLWLFSHETQQNLNMRWNMLKLSHINDDILYFHLTRTLWPFHTRSTAKTRYMQAVGHVSYRSKRILQTAWKDFYDMGRSKSITICSQEYNLVCSKEIPRFTYNDVFSLTADSGLFYTIQANFGRVECNYWQ